jgi:hypothetical protein
MKSITLFYLKQPINRWYSKIGKRNGSIERNRRKGFSPLTSYIRNLIQFYFQKILRISEGEEE